MEFGELLAAGFATGSGMAAVWYVVRVLVKPVLIRRGSERGFNDCWPVGTLE